MAGEIDAEPVILKSPTDPGSTLTRVYVDAEHGRDESWLEQLLFAHPEAIPGHCFGERCLIPLARQVDHMDLLCVTPQGRLCIVETKLFKNPEAHREVVAQVIDYAIRLSEWDYDTLCMRVSKSREHYGVGVTSLPQIMEGYTEDGDMEAFREAVEMNLETGEFLLMVVGDRISPRAVRLAQNIKGAPGLRFELGLVAMKLFALEVGQDWPLLVVPDVVARTVEVEHAVVRIIYEKSKPDVCCQPGNARPTGSRERPTDFDEKLRMLTVADSSMASVLQEWMDRRWQASGDSFLKPETTSAGVKFNVEIAGEVYLGLYIQIQTSPPPGVRLKMALADRAAFSEMAGIEAAYKSYKDRLESVGAAKYLESSVRWEPKRSEYANEAFEAVAEFIAALVTDDE